MRINNSGPDTTAPTTNTPTDPSSTTPTKNKKSVPAQPVDALVVVDGKEVIGKKTNLLVQPKILDADDDISADTTVESAAAFSQLATQVGGSRPSGTARSFLQADIPSLESQPGAFHPTLVQGGPLQVKINEALKAAQYLGVAKSDAKSGEMLDLLKATLSSAAVLQNNMGKLTPAQQEAFAKMAPEIAKQFKKHVADPVLGLGEATSDDQAAVFTGLSNTATQPGTAGETTQATSDLQIPDADMVKIEQSITPVMPSFAGMDIDGLIQMVMMESGKESDDELEDIATQMEAANQKKEQLRKVLDSQESKEAIVKTNLQNEYNRRTGLPKGDPEYIDSTTVTFDDFSSTQMLVQDVSPNVDADGIPQNDPNYALSPNETMYAQTPDPVLDDAGDTIPQTTVDEAAKLNITPQNMQTLQKAWDGDPALDVKFGGSMAYWLLSSTANGGVGLSGSPTAAQDAAVAVYLNASGNSDTEICQTYGLDQAHVNTMRTTWDDLPTAFQQMFGGSFENWISQPSPGMGIKPGQIEDNNSAVDNYLKALPELRQQVQGMESYGVDFGSLGALSDYYGTLNGNPASFDQFLTQNVGLQSPDDGQNAARVQTYFANNAQIGNTHAAWVTNEAAFKNPPPPPPEPDLVGSEPGNVGDLGTSMASAMQYIQGSSGMIDNSADDQLEELGISIGSGAPGGIDDLLRAFFTALLAMSQLKQSKGTSSSEFVTAEGQFNDAKTALASYLTQLSQLNPKRGALTAQYVQLQFAVAQAETQSGSTNASTSDSFAGSSMLEQSLDWQDSKPGNGDRNHIAGDNGASLNEKAFLYASQYLSNQGTTDPGGLNDWVANATAQWNASQKPQDPGKEPPNLTDGQVGILNNYFTPPADGSIGTTRQTTGPYSNTTSASSLPTADATDPNAPLGNPPPALAAQITALAAPVDHSLAQPNKIGVNGTEISLATLDANIQTMKDTQDTFGDMTDQMSLRIQMYQDRAAKFYQALSNIMKSVSDTANNIVQNIKVS